jgi:histidinol-phosphatase
MESPDSDVRLALTLADHADDAVLARWRHPGTARRKPDDSVVTEVDTAVERIVRAALTAARPGDAVLGEEGGWSGPRQADRTWYVDPLDGTANYLAASRDFGTLIALGGRTGELRLGVVSLPAHRLRWWGRCGAGAHHRDARGRITRIRPRAPRTLRASRLIVRMPGSWQRRGYAGGLGELTRRVLQVQVRHDAAGPCHVADGTADIAVTCGGAVWDLAAPMAVALAAGAAAGDFQGQPHPDRHTLAVASHPDLLAAVRDVLHHPGER